MALTQKWRFGVLAVVIAAATNGLVACSSSSGDPAGGGFKACMLSGTGGINDRGFNQSAWQGLKAGAKKLGLPQDAAKVLLPKTGADIVPQLQALVAQRCEVIVTVGFEALDATTASARTNPKQKYAIIDTEADPPADNVASLVFDDAQVGFVGGYAAASISKTRTVGTFGGTSSPPVNGWMDGYVEGVAYYNQQHNTKVKVIGWNEASQKGLYSESYSDQAKGKQLAEQLVSQGADVIFPVAGNVNLGAAQAAQNLGVSVLWSDTDGCQAAADDCDVFFGSALKNVAGSVEQLVVDTKKGDYKGGLHVGSFSSGGVSFVAGTGKAGRLLSEQTKVELADVQKGLIDGSIAVNSKNSPKAG